uniref:Uncharacterized protein n=1 Tax=Lepeophtheirus salmonis TaxID=72036 RepID=A0A0K2US61_LEPSM
MSNLNLNPMEENSLWEEKEENFGINMILCMDLRSSIHTIMKIYLAQSFIYLYIS